MREAIGLHPSQTAAGRVPVALYREACDCAPSSLGPTVLSHPPAQPVPSRFSEEHKMAELPRHRTVRGGGVTADNTGNGLGDLGMQRLWSA